MGKNNLLGTCPYCGNFYYMDEEDDKGYCGRKECAKKAGDFKVVEQQLAAGGKIVAFTKTGKENKIEEKAQANKVILKKPIDMEKEQKNAKKRKRTTKKGKSANTGTKTKSKKTNTRRVHK